ncbi:MAG TPA: hypothetical protein VGP68_10470, partial [Gemmataceae bacterium]|nr:hypothetical protein [Gemmataceae bacterium]
ISGWPRPNKPSRWSITCRSRLNCRHWRNRKYTWFPIAPIDIFPFVRIRVQQERLVNALRCVEAVRAYAATNDGKLPPNLAAIKDVKVPVDPLTGTPFEYTVTEKTAVLKGHVPPEEKNSPPEHLTYEITSRH